MALIRKDVFYLAQAHGSYITLFGKSSTIEAYMILSFIIAFLSSVAHEQTNLNQPQTAKYGGVFSYTKEKSGATGRIMIYPETDVSVLFYIEIVGGAPAHNMGSLYGRLKLNNGQGTFKSKDQGCQWTVQFSKDKLTIGTVKEFRNCEFGNGVTVDGVYVRTSNKAPDHFVNLEGVKYFFKSTTPEEYNNE